MKTKIGLLIVLLLGYYAISFAQSYGGWQQIDSLNEARYNHSAIQLANGDVLVVGGAVLGDAKSCEIYNINSNHWSEVARTNYVRGNHRLILLNSKRVLAVGSPVTKSCEIYDPDSNKWILTDSLKIGRVSASHQVVKLLDGRILVVGGYTRDYLDPERETLKMCEIYDEITGKWSIADSMKAKRSSHSATLLKDGRVLVAGGGISPNPLASCEIYDPSINKWSVTAPMNIAREHHNAVLLPSGKVLVIGGLANNNLILTKSCELYDPTQDKWEIVDSIQNSDAAQAAFIINDKDLLLIGTNYQQQLVWEIYDYIGFKSKCVNYLNGGSFVNNKIQLKDGKILVSGGVRTPDYEVYLPIKKCWIFDKNLTHVTETKDRENNDIFFQNYPNPFNPTTKISFSLQQKSQIKLKVFDVLGREIQILADGVYEAGKHEVEFNATNLPSGVYFYNLTTGSNSITKKMLLLR